MIILCIRQFLINLHQQISSAVVMITAKIDYQTVFLFKTVKRSQIFNCEYFINRLIHTDIRRILLTPHRNSDSFRESTDICCLLPGVPGKTENITVTSIVGRFLEHSRIYVFGRGENEKMYISSADLMTRNTERRVEIACPIDSPAVRARLHDILFAMQHDTVKARVLQPDGSYQKKPAVPEPICAQDLLMQQAVSMAREQAQHASEEERGLLHRLRRLFVKD